MNRVKIVVCSREYIIQTEEEPSYVYDIAKELEQKINSIITSSTTVSVSSASVMVAMSLLDDLHKITEASSRLRSQVKGYVDDAGKAKMERDEALKEIDFLKSKLSALEENDKLKKLGESIKQ